MSVRISVSDSAIKAGIDAAWEKTVEELSSQILRDCNIYCKQDTTALIYSSLTHSDLKKGLLVWQTPYAARQYYEIQTAYKEKNPNASWRWVEVAEQAHKPEWTRQAEALMRYYK